MRRYVVVTAAGAAAVISGAVALGGTHHSNPKPTPSSTSPLQITQDVREKCEQSRDQTRKEHPDAVIGDCNYGEGALTTP